MTGRRPDREPFEAIEVGIRRLRLLGLAVLGLALMAPGGHRPDLTGMTILVALAGLTLIADRASVGLAGGSERVEALVALQIGTDVMVVVGTLLVIDPGPADGIWLIVALPVLEGGVRHGLLGGVTVWLTITLPVAALTIVAWAPGDGLDPMIDTLGLLLLALAIALPAGWLTDRLVDELLARRWERRQIEQQVHLVSVLAVAGNELAAVDDERLCRTLVEAAVELGFPGAELAVVAKDTGYHQLLASEPAGYATGGPSGVGDDAELRRAAVGTSHLGPTGELVGVLANHRHAATVLTVGAEEDRGWRPRHEAFEVLCRYGAASVRSAARRQQIEQAANKLDHRRSHDPLTGVLNRAGFTAAVTSALGQLTPGAEVRVFAIDLADFAAIKATNGWSSVDQVLIEVAARLGRTSPSGAAVARLDGDLFAVVTDDAAANYLADHLCDILSRPISTAHGAIVVEASVGQVITADPAGDPATAIRDAELRARAAGAATYRRPTARGSN